MMIENRGNRGKVSKERKRHVGVGNPQSESGKEMNVPQNLSAVPMGFPVSKHTTKSQTL